MNYEQYYSKPTNESSLGKVVLLAGCGCTGAWFPRCNPPQRICLKITMEDLFPIKSVCPDILSGVRNILPFHRRYTFQFKKHNQNKNKKRSKTFPFSYISPFLIKLSHPLTNSWEWFKYFKSMQQIGWQQYLFLLILLVIL
jgi:hypothetical protein